LWKIYIACRGRSFGSKKIGPSTDGAASQRRLWGELIDVPSSFVLCGDTAVALRLGHRFSTIAIGSWRKLVKSGPAIGNSKTKRIASARSPVDAILQMSGRRIGQPQRAATPGPEAKLGVVASDSKQTSAPPHFQPLVQPLATLFWAPCDKLNQENALSPLLLAYSSSSKLNVRLDQYNSL